MKIYDEFKNMREESKDRVIRLLRDPAAAEMDSIRQREEEG